MKKLYFIRHGESEANAQRFFAGRLDVPLSKLGIQQAKTAALHAKKLDINLIVSSPLKRARQTAEIIAHELGYPKNKIIYIDSLVERDYGSLQGTSFDSLENIDFDSVPGIESVSSVEQRALSSSKRIKSLKHDHILVVGHGTLGRALQKEVMKLAGSDIEVSEENGIPNAEIIRWI